MPRPFTGVYKFTAKWCGPCQTIKESLPRAVRKHLGQSHYLHVVDVDADEETAKAFRVTAMPTIVFVLLGEEQGDLRVQGANMAQIEQNLQIFSTRLDSRAEASNQNDALPLDEDATVRCQASKTAAATRNKR